jgi:hypothetical protein
VPDVVLRRDGFAWNTRHLAGGENSLNAGRNGVIVTPGIVGNHGPFTSYYHQYIAIYRYSNMTTVITALKTLRPWDPIRNGSDR